MPYPFSKAEGKMKKSQELSMLTIRYKKLSEIEDLKFIHFAEDYCLLEDEVEQKEVFLKLYVRLDTPGRELLKITLVAVAETLGIIADEIRVISRSAKKLGPTPAAGKGRHEADPNI
jgi:hypothetical protein